MRKLFAIFLTVTLIMVSVVVPVSAWVDYSGYIGTWQSIDSGMDIQIKRCDGNTISFHIFDGWNSHDFENLPIQNGIVQAKYSEGDPNTSHIHDYKAWWFLLELNADGITLTDKLYNNRITKLKPSFGFKRIESSDIKVIVNGKTLETDQNPMLINQRTMVPMRAIFEELGYNVAWSDTNRTIEATDGTNTINMQIDNKTMRFNSKRYDLDVTPTIIGGRTLVPVRAISEAAGYNVSWDGSTQTVGISSDSKTPDYSSYTGVWQQYTFSSTIPETELIIHSISGNEVKYDILMYRLAGYENQTAIINSDGVIQFDTVVNEYSNDPIHGNIKLSDNKAVLTIASSENPNVSAQTIIFDKKVASSMLK